MMRGLGLKNMLLEGFSCIVDGIPPEPLYFRSLRHPLPYCWGVVEGENPV
jgi:hypothetical protein